MDKPVNKVAVVVEITSDVVCPWCWVGKKRLDLAIERLKDEFTFHILWKPFLLIPNVPDEGIPLKDYVLKRFGKSAAEKFTSENSPLHQNAAEVGIVFNNSRLVLPTKKAHMLLDHASKQGKQHELHDAIFRAYYGDARKINDDTVLVEIAASVGLDPEAARQALYSSEAEQEYERGIAWAQSEAISGVPHFEIYLKDKPGPHQELSGAQPVDTFVAVIKRLKTASRM
ncbi:hypothetical protein EMCRGX_G016473 [Ephydatia muelleri]